MSGIIEVDHHIVRTHRVAISGHSSSFDVTITSSWGGIAPAIAKADEVGIKIGGIAGRYATALPNSANDIQWIANTLSTTDCKLSEIFG